MTPNTRTTLVAAARLPVSKNNTLIVRFEERLNARDNQGIGGCRLPPPSPSAGLQYHWQQPEPDGHRNRRCSIRRSINETRFQFTRNDTQPDRQSVPQISVSDAFTSGGNGVGTNYDIGKHFELQNYTSILHGAHTFRFGVRVRRESDQSNESPADSTAHSPSTAASAGAERRQPDCAGCQRQPRAHHSSLSHSTFATCMLRRPVSPPPIGAGLRSFPVQHSRGQSVHQHGAVGRRPVCAGRLACTPQPHVQLGLRYESRTTSATTGYRAPFGLRLGAGLRQERPAEDRVPRRIRHFLRPGRRLALSSSACCSTASTSSNYTVTNPDIFPNIPPLSDAHSRTK